MAIIKTKQAPNDTQVKEVSADDLLATFCYYFPQYTFAQARKMPYIRIKQMLLVVRREQAKTMYDMVNVVRSANATKKGYEQMLQYFKNLSEK